MMKAISFSLLILASAMTVQAKLVTKTFIAYSGAMHAFGNPNADKAHVAGLAYNAEAATRSWNQMKLFFGEIFGQ